MKKRLNSLINIQVLFLLLLSSLGQAHSRDLEIKSFELLQNDISARTNPVRDFNGELCALMRVSLPERECRFDGGVIKQIYDINEYLVYLTPDARFVTLKYEGTEPLKIDLKELLNGEDIQSGASYRLSLTGYEEIYHQKPKSDAGGNFLIVDLIPKTNAIVKIDDVPQSLDDGQVMTFLKYGRYLLTVEAEGYSKEQREVIIDKSGNTEVEIKLQSTKAQLEIQSATKGTTIKVNNQTTQSDNYNSFLVPGYYQIEVTKEGYEPFAETIQLNPKEKKVINVPELTPITGILKVSYKPVGSNVIIDGKDYGKTPLVINDILIGNHDVTIRRSNYDSFKTKILIEEGKIFDLSGNLNKKINQDYDDYKNNINNSNQTLISDNRPHSFNAIERASQMAVLNYLKNQGYKAQIDDADNSVMFFINQKFYYITFNGDGKGVLYTLHAQPVKFIFEDKDERAGKMEAAEKAANLMNSNGPVKAYLANDRLHFTYPIFAKDPYDYLKVLPNVIDEINKARDKANDSFLKKRGGED